MRSFGVMAAMALALTGCQTSGPTRISYVTVEPAYRYNEWASVASSGEVRTVVVGDPFSVGREHFDQTVTDAMYGHNWGPPVKFTTKPSDKANPHYSVVMLFDVPPTYGGVQVCRDSAKAAGTHETAQSDQPIYVAAAYCLEDVPLTYLAGVVARTTPDDPAFRNYIGQVTSRLFPSFNQEQLPDHDHDLVFPP
jgi:hypothetical protein